MVTPGTVTIAPGAAITGSDGFMGRTFWYGNGMTLDNQGTISASTTNGTLDIDADPVTKLIAFTGRTP